MPDRRGRRRVVLLTDGQSTVGLAGRGLSERQAVAELSAELADLTRAVPHVTLVPIGVPSGVRHVRDTAVFRARGVDILELDDRRR